MDLPIEVEKNKGTLFEIIPDLLTKTQAGMIIWETTVGGEKVKMIRGAWKGHFQYLAEQTFPVWVKMKIKTDAFDRQMPQQ